MKKQNYKSDDPLNTVEQVAELKKLRKENIKLLNEVKGLKRTLTLQKISKTHENDKLRGESPKGRDIPDQKTTENTLINFVTRYWELVSHLPEIIFETDAKGKITFLNQKAFEGNGYSVTAFKKGITLFELLAPEDVVRAKTAFKLAKNGKELSGEEFAILTSSNHKIVVMVFTSNMYQTGKWVGVRGVAIDITTRKEAENKEKEYHEKLIFLSKAALDFLEMQQTTNIFTFIGSTLKQFIKKGIVIVNRFNDANSLLGIEYYSDSEIYGDKLAKILGFSMDLFSLRLNDENIGNLMTHSEHLFEVNDGIYELSFSLLPHAVCQKIENLLQVKKIYVISLMRSGKLYGTVSIMQELEDPQDKTLIETFCHQASIVLHRRQLENELINAKEKAEESDRLKTSFIANMSHEIRTPMNGILGLTQLLHNPSLGEENRKEYLSLITVNGKLLLNLVNDIIDISRIESNQIDIHEDPFSLCSLFKEIEHFFTLEKKVQKKDDLQLIFSNCMDSPLANILGDVQKIRQILTNLVNNAIKFTSEGEIDVGCRLQEDGTLLFYVRDTGIGIPASQQDEVFNRFTQVDQSLTRSFGGSGLGLAICRGLVEKMGGKIWVQSGEGGGSVFYFTLPYKPAYKIRELPEGGPSKDFKFDWSGLSILVVEDNYISYRLFQLSLQNTGVRLLHADTGYKAIEMVEAHPEIDLVLMDIQLPLLNGYDATRKIKVLRPSLPVIAQTANATQEDKVLCIDAGCNDFITKPIHLERLYELLTTYLFKS